MPRRPKIREPFRSLLAALQDRLAALPPETAQDLPALLLNLHAQAGLLTAASIAEGQTEMAALAAGRLVALALQVADVLSQRPSPTASVPPDPDTSGP